MGYFNTKHRPAHLPSHWSIAKIQGQLTIRLARVIYRLKIQTTVGEGKELFSLYPSRFPAGALTKDRVLREKHTHLLNVSFTWYSSLPTEMKTQRNGSSWVFYTWLDEEWEVVGKWDRTNRHELNWGNSAKPVSLDSSCSLLFWEGRMPLSGRCAPGAVCTRVQGLWPASGEGQTVLPAPAVSHIPEA